jgi:23S rRNA (guanosine2251-2'-O)-methyltransferase
MSDVYIYGRHAVSAVLNAAPGRVLGLYVNSHTEHEFAPMGNKLGISVQEITPKLQREFDGHVHQGIFARVSMKGLMRDYGEFMNGLEPSASTCLVLLNEISDPYNVGAIIRSAAAFGAAGVLIPAHNQAPVTGVVAKASAGTIFSIPLVTINNENQTILDLKKRRFWIYGLAMEGRSELSKEKFNAPAVFVIGSEGEGLRQKTAEHCDVLLKIPMHWRVESLNASVSAGIVLSAWGSQHPEALA